MFVNLIRINTLKFRKSSFFRWGAIVTLFVMIAFCAIYYFTMTINSDLEMTKDTWRDGRDIELAWHLLFLHTSRFIVQIFYSICAIVMVCEHYSVREMINIRGMVNSNVKWFYAEVCGVMIYALPFGIFPLLAGDIPAKIYGIDFAIFNGDWINTLLLYLGSILYLIFAMLPAIVIAKIFRRTAVSLSAYAVFSVLNLLLGVVADALAEEFLNRATKDDSFSGTIINPASWLLDYQIDGKADMSFTMAMICLVIYAVIWLGIGTLASMRRNEL